ncbi:hypothetical protein ABZ716_05725 [Streptomyces sp. NPDC006687]|uniref:hypothetical protein n=1 Tax=unclassified Streptomyces TaxID=2593676 RepID=UPI0033E41C65
MTSVSSRPRLQRVTCAGSALAVALVPLVVGVLVAKGTGADPHGPVNALMTGGGRPAGLPHGEWSRRGHAALRRLRTARRGVRSRCGALREPAAPGRR